MVGYVLDGEGTPADRALAAFQAGGIDAVTALDGSHATVVVDHVSGQTWALTDVVSSRAVYLWDEGTTILITNELSAGPTSRHALNPAGIASYLSSDGAHGGLTPYEGVTALAPGSVAEVVPGGVKVSRYWRLSPEPVRQSEDFRELRGEMARLMRRSVRRRLEAAGHESVRISLSGGVDSKGLLGMLLENLAPEDVTAMTYFYGEQVGDMDFPEAARVARAAGVRHQPIPGYRGNFTSLLAYNALRGEGVAHFCDEGDVWRFWRDVSGASVMVVGDRQAHSLGSTPDLAPRQLLRLVSVFPPEAIEWWLPCLAPDVAASMLSGWGERFESLCAEYGAMYPWARAVHPAYIEERSSRTLALWRERFSSEAGIVLNPYLDRALLDFVGSLPEELNQVDGRFLHRESILANWPEVADGVASHGGWNAPSWATEIQRQAPRLRQIVRDVDSRLEELIPKDVVLDLVTEVEQKGASLTDASEGLGWQLRKAVKRSTILSAATRKVKTRRKLTKPARVEPATLVRELLTIHLALADPDQVASLVPGLDPSVSTSD